MVDNRAHHDNLCQVRTIEVLPDDVLLAIFDFCVVGDQDLPISGKKHDSIVGVYLIIGAVEWWQPLVHVCRRWRGLVFGLSRRLNLQLCCTFETVTKKILDVWPALPLIVMNHGYFKTPVDNLTSVLEHSKRIRQIHIFRTSLTTSQIEKIWAAMQVPFLELTALKLTLACLSSETMTVLPDSFLGGSAPRLRLLTLRHIPFPGLQKLLLSATHLVDLHLYGVPHSGYISPKEMATCLSLLTSLERLSLEFESPQSGPNQESGRDAPPPPTRPILPKLLYFWFKGVHEYLEDLLARFDAPQLHRLGITFFNDILFDTPQLIQFIDRRLAFKPPPPNVVHVAFCRGDARFELQTQSSNFEKINVNIKSREPDWQLSALAEICASFQPLFSATESLYIYEYPLQSSKLDWKDGIEDIEWLELLFPFTAVKNLYLSKGLGPRIAPALQELTGDQMREVLPTLRGLFLEGFQPSEPVQKGIGQFISGRQLANNPITVSSWDTVPERVVSMTDD